MFFVFATEYSQSPQTHVWLYLKHKSPPGNTYTFPTVYFQMRNFQMRNFRNAKIIVFTLTTWDKPKPCSFLLPWLVRTSFHSDCSTNSRTWQTGLNRPSPEWWLLLSWWVPWGRSAATGFGHYVLRTTRQRDGVHVCIKTHFKVNKFIGGSVAWWFGRWICNPKY